MIKLAQIYQKLNKSESKLNKEFLNSLLFYVWHTVHWRVLVVKKEVSRSWARLPPQCASAVLPRDPQVGSRKEGKARVEDLHRRTNVLTS